MDNKKIVIAGVLALCLMGGAGVKLLSSRGVKEVRMATVRREIQQVSLVEMIKP